MLRSRQWIAALLIGMGGILLVTGCGNQEKEQSIEQHNLNKGPMTSLGLKDQVRRGGLDPNHERYPEGRYQLDQAAVREDDENIHDNVSVSYSKELTSKVSRFRGIKDAQVLLTPNNAYVAVSLEDHDVNRSHAAAGVYVNEAIKARIALLIKRNHPEIDQVFVSANRGFYQMMERDANALQHGTDERGVLSHFNDEVKKTFPLRTKPLPMRGLDGSEGERGYRSR